MIFYCIRMDITDGTAPCDYRGRLNEIPGYTSSGMRMIVSTVSILETLASNKTFRRIFLNEWEGMAPEYLLVEDREEHLSTQTHWKVKDRSKTIKTPSMK